MTNGQYFCTDYPALTNGLRRHAENEEFYLKGLGFSHCVHTNYPFNQECALFKREQLTQKLTSVLKQRAVYPPTPPHTHTLRHFLSHEGQ